VVKWRAGGASGPLGVQSGARRCPAARPQAHARRPLLLRVLGSRAARLALPIDDCAAACLLELVVHADELAVSVGLEPVVFSEPAIDLVVVTLSRISRKRHGDVAVIRSLSRPERAPAHGISAF
jgi:hypothetical protein